MMSRWWQDLRQSSLRFRYWSVSVILLLILVIGAYSAHRDIAEISSQSSSDFKTQQAIADHVRHLREALESAETLLDDVLFHPRVGQWQSILENLKRATMHAEALRTMPLTSNGSLARMSENLLRTVRDLQARVQRLLKYRQDVEWIYPMLPFLDRTLRQTHEAFLTQADLAMAEIEDAAITQPQFQLYRRIAKIRRYWVDKTLDFRALMIRYAGLNERSYSSQEKNIDILQAEIDRLVRSLQTDPEFETWGLQVQESIAQMLSLSRQWQEQYRLFQELRNTNVWRNDLEYVQSRIRPVQKELDAQMHGIEAVLAEWTQQNVERLKAANVDLTQNIWLFLFLASVFLGLVYWMVDRSLLGPIQHITGRIRDEGASLQPLAVAALGGPEVQLLVDAYNRMRQELHLRQSALEHQALHDALTGLPNRVLLQDRLEQVMNHSRRKQTETVFVLLDLNRFKEINDTLGHPVGDQVLQVVSRRLASGLRESDTVARLGGDEFAIVAADLQEGSLPTFLQKIVSLVSEVVTVGGHDLYVGASLGVALYPRHGDDVETLIRRADIAMYRAKRLKRDYVIYEPAHEEYNSDDLALLRDLRDELDAPGDALQLHYQPQMRLQSRRVETVEALLRWRHPVHGWIPPDNVIRLAEQSGLIVPLTRWVLERAIADCAAWQTVHPGMGVAVNLSAWDIQDAELVDSIASLLKSYDLSGSLLTLEITESAVMHDTLRAREILNQLNTLGIALAIDDYGTGFSSLAYLKMLPVASLKIDRSFVMEMLENYNDAIIVHSTVELAHNLGLEVVAEGVENATTLERLLDYGCDAVQGYHVGRPMPRDQLLDWLPETVQS